MEISCEENITVLTAEKRDESFIHEILKRLSDLNLTLISVNPLEND